MNTKLRLLIFPALMLLCAKAGAQPTEQEKPLAMQAYRTNAVYFELGGPGLLYSVGYEGTFYHAPHFSAIVNIGAEYVPPIGAFGLYFQPGVLFHFNKSALELGLALSYLSSDEKEEGYSAGGAPYTIKDESRLAMIVPRLGYRYTFSQNKYFFRFGISPLILLYDDEPEAFSDKGETIFWGNVSFGIRF